ncbi:50S ribosomal protein L17 [Roseivirga misakiensis]|uniref:Large ribosomal subunit protein bL17 n=1 Tax=Roseivirga misakiensis TaxID=1563681 RepID=A0A1E5SKE8_9BACT|nr:50S ribosomal protein L17 [Roseivirga misakiensis]OEJ99599.1 50S ribosomal protein L17 [Roseivirga misakiensis]
MRHGKKFNHLSRTASHRKAMLSNMASSLIEHKRITTTVAKAKALRKYVEPLITKAKDDTTHSRRVVFSYLQDKESVTTLFNEVAEKVASRPGGYTRIIKTNNRLGDNADMCIIELVDYNELLLAEAAPAPKAKRSRRGGKKKTTAKAEVTATDAVVVEDEVAEAPVADVVEETPAAEVEETPTAETEDAPEASADEATEESSDEEKKDAE